MRSSFGTSFQCPSAGTARRSLSTSLCPSNTLIYRRTSRVPSVFADRTVSYLCRTFASTSRRSTPPPSSSSPAATPSSSNAAISPDTPSQAVSEKEQTWTDWAIIKKLAVNIWPKNAFQTKVRVVGALALLVGGKVLNVQVPFFFKDIVDSLNVPITSETTVWVLAGTAIAGCES